MDNKGDLLLFTPLTTDLQFQAFTPAGEGRVLGSAIAQQFVQISNAPSIKEQLFGNASPAALMGTPICDWQVSPNGTPSTIDLWPEAGTIITSVPQGLGASAAYAASLSANGVALSNVPSTFNNLLFKFKCNPRVDGEKFGVYRVFISSDVIAVALANTFANSVFCTFTARADGRWRTYAIDKQITGVIGTFVLGTSTMNAIRFLENGAITALTTTASLSANDTSATLTVAFAGATNPYRVRFSNNDVRTAQLTNGSAAITWIVGLSASATTALVYGGTNLRTGGQAADAFQVGPVSLNHTGRGFAFVRFDDCTRDQYYRRQSLSVAFVGTSGITIPASTPYSMLDLVEAFGLKANLFILTGNVDKSGFLSVQDLLAIQARGHAVCFQTHYNPLDSGNLGTRLLGPLGYNLRDNIYGSIASVSTAANTITTTNIHKITRVPGGATWGNQGYAVAFYGTDLPVPLVAGTIYWLRETTTTAFTLHLTEDDSVNAVNAIDLTTTGTVGNFNYRYANSTADESGIVADIRAGQLRMRQWGLLGWQHIAPNQGAIDYWVEEAYRQLKLTDELRGVYGIVSGAANSATFTPRLPLAHTGAGIAIPGVSGSGITLSDIYTTPTALQTDSASDITSTGTNTIAPFIDALANRGGIGSNYHHFLFNQISMVNFCSYLDRLRLRSSQNAIATGTVIDLWAALVAFGSEPNESCRQ